MQSSTRTALLVVASIPLVLALVLSSGCAGGTATGFLLALTANPTTVAVGGGSTILATLTQSGVPVAGQTVTWSVAPAGAVTFSTTAGVTDANGQTQVVATGATAGTATVTAASGGTTQSVTLTVTGGGSGPAVALTLSGASTTVGGTLTATATFTNNGTAQAGQTVTFTVADTTFATASPGSATTDAAGQATTTITGVAAGSTTITATAGGATSGAQAFTVTAVIPTATDHVLFTNFTAVEFQVAEDVAGGGTIANADLGGIRIPMATQRSGPLVLVSPSGFATALVRNLDTGTETAFTPSALSFAGAGFTHEYTAGITAAGDRVIWLRVSGGNVEIVRANLDGSSDTVLFTGAGATAPVALAISPDDSQVAFIDAAGGVNRIATDGSSGGAAVALNLATSTGPAALEWIDNSDIAVGVANHMASALPGIIRVFANGNPAVSLFNASGVGLRSTPTTVAVDSVGNILYNEADVSLLHSEIYRLDAPGYAARVDIVVRSSDDLRPAIVRY